jgi:hypothetical protein
VVWELVARGVGMAIYNTITKWWGQSSRRGQHYTVYFDKTEWHYGWGLEQDALLQRLIRFPVLYIWEDNTNQPSCRVLQETFKEYKSVDFLSGSSIYYLCLHSFVQLLRMLWTHSPSTRSSAKSGMDSASLPVCVTKWHSGVVFRGM